PGFITMYMCRETIRKAVVQKFNEAKGWNCESITALYNKIDDIEEANQIVDSLKICDPAVGSGHFLVSALNEIIAVKNDLRILRDRNGKRLKEYHVEVENDELIITDEEGAIFEYNPKSRESQRVQETLFHEKQTIIENCLFGVDINPNSVKICRLRLWIELLKNAYYKTETELETLPNIDINIKCGNSLISRFAIDADLGQALKKSKWTIDSYRIAVDTYRNAHSKEQKREMERLIADIKSDFRSEIAQNDPKLKRLQKAKGELFTLTNQTTLFEKTKKEKDEWNRKLKKLTDEVKKLEAEIEEIKNNKIYENAFEWRFEFPEVLNEKGDFVGFDVVIGNPPYGVSIKGAERNHLVLNISKVPDYEIYYWFIDRSHQIIKNFGISSLIIPNTILFNVFAQEYRLNLFNNWSITEILDCTDINIFEDATVRNIIYQFIKTNNANTLSYKSTNEIISFNSLISRNLITLNKGIVEVNNQNWGLIFKLSPDILETTRKIKLNSIPLINLFPETSQGLIAYDKYKGQSKEIIDNRVYHHFENPNNEYKKWLYGEDVIRYKLTWNGKEYIDYCDGIANPREQKYFIGKRILIREITNPRIYSTLTDEEFYNDPAIIIVKENPNSFSIESLLAIINSKLATFYHFNSSPKATKGAFPKILVYDVNNFPLPLSISESTDNQLKNIVTLIIEKKKESIDNDTSNLEREIDDIIYGLYDLTDEEIAIVENSVK
ncbi:MAG TPA: TaqI-like C-terminal specificity domain-containing protein, partial [Tenuifilaceae bacterium]|nr:TaqI-like C-terminal specificity domain-containing protein [Tenuifilaceae bacterium]